MNLPAPALTLRRDQSGSIDQSEFETPGDSLVNCQRQDALLYGECFIIYGPIGMRWSIDFMSLLTVCDLDKHRARREKPRPDRCVDASFFFRILSLKR